MITVKLLGGAKKSFSTDKITINQDDLTIQKLLDYLIEHKPAKTLDLDVNNLLIAVNGVDSSAMQGKSTTLKTDDIVTIIPIIHGGSSRRLRFTISKSLIELMEVTKGKRLNATFLDELREKFPTLIIQGISSCYILNKSHAKKIITISLEAKKNHTLLSQKLETDIIMRFACSTQISQAIQTVGIKKNQSFIVIAIGKKLILDKLYYYIKPFLNSKPISKNNHNFLKKQFKISKTQMNAVISKYPLEDLLTEKAAILV